MSAGDNAAASAAGSPDRFLGERSAQESSLPPRQASGQAEGQGHLRSQPQQAPQTPQDREVGQMSPKQKGLLFLFAAIAVLSLGGSASAAEFDKYAIETASASLSSAQAGAHADFTTGFSLTQQGGEPYGLTRDVIVKVPPGLTGNPQAIQHCSSSEFGIEPKLSECPIDSQVGTAEVTLAGEFSGTFVEPIYNLERPSDDDVVARLGFFALLYPVTIDITVDPVDYGLVAKVQGAAAAANLLSVSTTLWGVPAAKSHDPFRLTPKEVEESNGPAGGHEATQPAKPFMTNPTSCGAPGEVSITATSYQLPGSPSSKSAPLPQIVGCEKVKFFPSFSLTPTNPEAAAPSAVD